MVVRCGQSAFIQESIGRSQYTELPRLQTWLQRPMAGVH
jgi:hypothetical protein